MANPAPKLENLRPPWPKGTSGNPAGYSRGRRISDVIKTQIDELGLTEEFATSAIAVALGYKQILKKNVQDPETGEDIWIELKPDIAWFKLILKLVEPAAQKPDDMRVLNALRAKYDREKAEKAKLRSLKRRRGAILATATRKSSQPARSARARQRPRAAARSHLRSPSRFPAPPIPSRTR